ncbi:T9SS type A sorting domain-containing protein [Bacteroidota bacterium]
MKLLSKTRATRSGYKIRTFKLSFSILFLFILLLFYGKSSAQRIIIPQDQPTIQAGINAAVDGDTVLVEEGRYFENINFRGKNIVVASYYTVNGNRNLISTTIIDGSRPVEADTASCVLIISGEDSTAVLQGFTITNGTGTKWRDEHGAGTYYEGGGILITLSSPTIKNNIIYNNSAIRTGPGISSSGGGGIRIGDGNPKILNNIIMSNKGMYGGGIVLNYTGGTIKNNIIYNNSVYQAVSGFPTFGGGGIWVYNTIPGAVRIIENNTIIGNTAYGTGSSVAGRGGGVLLNSIQATVVNNIIWGNSASSGVYSQISPNATTLTYITYCNIMNGKSRQGEVILNPGFSDTGFFLNENSPCIDEGNPGSEYWDPAEDPDDRFHSKPPSRGERRNDIGAYGGPGADTLPIIPALSKGNISDEIDFGDVSYGESKSAAAIIENMGTHPFYVDSIVINQSMNEEFIVETSFPIKIAPFEIDSAYINWTTTYDSDILQDTMLVYHNSESIDNPYLVIIKGESKDLSSDNGIKDKTEKTPSISHIYPNPVKDMAVISYSLAKNETVLIDLLNLQGKQIKSLLREFQTKGEHQLVMSSNDIQTGIYLLRLQTGHLNDVKRIIKN